MIVLLMLAFGTLISAVSHTAPPEQDRSKVNRAVAEGTLLSSLPSS